MTDSTELSVGVTVQADADADAEETAALRGLVRSMLVEQEFDVTDAPLDAEAPPGAKVGDPVSISSLVVTLAASGGVLTTFVGALQAWLLRSSARRVVVEIDGDRLEVNGLNSQERRLLTAAWLERHRSTADSGQIDGD